MSERNSSDPTRFESIASNARVKTDSRVSASDAALRGPLPGDSGVKPGVLSAAVASPAT